MTSPAAVPHDAIEPSPGVCDNCGAVLVGPFCHACGQRDVDHLASVRSFVAHLFEVFLQYDSRALRTLRLILTQPGALTAEYMDGRRVRYIPPLQTYLYCTALLFLAAGVHPLVHFDAVKASYGSSLAGTVGFNDKLTSYQVARYAAEGMSLRIVGLRFIESANATLSSTLVVVVPVFALVLALLHAGTRRSVARHVVFTLHWIGVYMLVMAATQILPTAAAHNAIYLRIVMLAMLAYLILALRRAYGSGWLASIARGLLAMLVMQVALVQWLASVSGMVLRKL